MSEHTRGRSDAAVAGWILRLRHGDAEEVRAAAEALGALGPAAAAAVPALARTLRVTDVRAHDAWYEQWDDSPVGEAEMEAQEGQFAYDCRIYAAEALGRIGPAARKAIPALVRAIVEDDGHSDWGGSLAASAGEALVRIGPGAVPALVKALGSGGLREDAEAAIREALGGYGAEAVPFLIGLLRDGSLPDDVRDRALELIAALGDAAVPALVTALPGARGPLFATLTDLLVRRGPAAGTAVPVLQRARRSRSAERRRIAAAALGRIARAGKSLA